MVIDGEEMRSRGSTRKCWEGRESRVSDRWGRMAKGVEVREVEIGKV